MGRTKQPDRTSGPSDFKESTFLAIAEDLKSGMMSKIKDRLQVSDDMVAGLKANIQKSGRITYHIQYYVGEDRPFLAIGHGNKDMDDYITVAEARERAKKIKALGAMGIDPQDGLYHRLLREIDEQGENWRPNKADRGKVSANRKK